MAVSVSYAFMNNIIYYNQVTIVQGKTEVVLQLKTIFLYIQIFFSVSRFSWYWVTKLLCEPRKLPKDSLMIGKYSSGGLSGQTFRILLIK